ncbi:amphi-Trp domain-containing protein [Aeromicrobium sp. SMF47]|uniref:Amphi-Trp domain-containing protein n=1 Tax=Aeromicrobium yanjiei TaxID=2662028 RepID=A0A5Q2MFI0_9ACTN|nr:MULTISPECIES: amphi-Trp domain-containing protein [Aeromicrobium]MRJ76962.1 amphi-Trp domain-containing protein [Aeromicrobium yanjiei]MRK01306.1 amphi-Trp domain-containing protein [Aeromicrobium sp. S22]QGG41917.1 amphi-Trp domain-containing protein [Aeromicrobium yanjiei]
MDLFETESTQRLSREAAAERLRALADALSRHNSIELERGGHRITVDVPDEVSFSLEVEVGDENEIEIELSW